VQVHALCVPATSSRPWCQVVAAARGDGSVEVFDLDADAQASSSSSGSGSSRSGAGGGKQGKGTAEAGDGSCSSSSVAVGDGEVVEGGRRNVPWRGPLVLNRAQGGHTRPATTAAFLGDVSVSASNVQSTDSGGRGSSSSTSASKQQGAAAGAPSHLLSGSEDRRLLLWRLPLLGQLQGGGTEWRPQTEQQGSEGGPDGDGRRSLLAESFEHGRKINCVHIAPNPTQQQHSSVHPYSCVAFVGDTSRRVSCYRIEV